MEFQIEDRILVSVIGTDEEFSVPKGVVTIGDQCFTNCPNLRFIQIPEGVKFIQEYAFNGCPELKFINLPETLRIVAPTFLSGCRSIDTIVVGSMPVTTFGFYDRSISLWNYKNFGDIESDFNYPDPTITRVRKILFKKTCQFKDQPWITNEGLTIPMGNFDPFAMVDVEEFEVEEGNTYVRSIGGILYNHDATILLRCPSAIKRTEISMPDSVIIIGNHAFANCTNIEHINLSQNLRYINWAAFLDCENLQEIVIPYNFKSVNNHFEACALAVGCKSLKCVIAPSHSVTCFNPGIRTTWYVYDRLITSYRYALPTYDPNELLIKHGVDYEVLLPLSSYPEDKWLPDWVNRQECCYEWNYDDYFKRMYDVGDNNHPDMQESKTEKDVESLDQKDSNQDSKFTDRLNLMYRGEHKGINMYGPISNKEYNSLLGNLCSPVRGDKSKSRNPSIRKKHKK